jgi:parvulin-like peptidyl-prolyl isomerase
MKRLATVFLSATLLSSTVLAADNKVVATYTGGNVTADQVMEQFNPVLAMQPESKGKSFSELDKNVQEVLVKGYINSKLLEQEADKLKIRDSQEFKTKIKGIETQMIQQEILERQIKDKITDKMVEDEYKALTTNLKGQEEVKTSHILLDTEEKAKEIKKKLNKGTNFADLVKEFSKDEGSKANGGEIGYVLKGQLVPEYEEKAFSLKKNEVSDPVKTQFGWHIIKMLDKRGVQIPTKEQAEQSIKNKLSKDIVEKYFTELAAKAKIELKL